MHWSALSKAERLGFWWWGLDGSGYLLVSISMSYGSFSGSWFHYQYNVPLCNSCNDYLGFTRAESKNSVGIRLSFSVCLSSETAEQANNSLVGRPATISVSSTAITTNLTLPSRHFPRFLDKFSSLFFLSSMRPCNKSSENYISGLQVSGEFRGSKTYWTSNICSEQWASDATGSSCPVILSMFCRRVTYRYLNLCNNYDLSGGNIRASASGNKNIAVRYPSFITV